MSFEKEFKDKIRQKIINSVEKNFERYWTNFDKLEEDYLADLISDILRDIKIFINFYNQKITDKSKQIHFDFKEISIESIMDLKRKIQLNQKEKEQIEYECEMEFYERNYGIAIYTIAEILIRRLLLEKMGIPDLTGFEQVVQQECENNRVAERYLYTKSLISGELFNESEEKFLKMISNRVEEEFNWRINCGGYALEIDSCIFPRENDFERNVSSILELFPFVRLLGDTDLKDDEYLVLYRCSGELEEGHHFIKRTEDGSFSEKCGGNAPQRFEDWHKTFRNSPEAAFAVKKDHDMGFFSKQRTIMLPIAGAKNFEESVVQAIKNKQNTFEYHNHMYQLKKTSEGIIYVCSNEKIVAQVLIDDKDWDIEIEEEYRRYISNTGYRSMVMKNSTGKIKRDDDIGEEIEDR